MLITVNVQRDQMGNILVALVNEAWRNAFAAHVTEFTGHDAEDEATVFFQDGGPATEFIDTEVPESLKADLDEGGSIEFEIDPWIVGHWYGYDAHTVAE